MISRERLLDLRDDVVNAKVKLRSRGGTGLLRFSSYEQMGWIISSSRVIVEVLCFLWNNAEEILSAAAGDGEDDE